MHQQLFDLRAGAVRWEANAGNGVTGLEFDRRVGGARFAASCWWLWCRGHCLWDNGDNDNDPPRPPLVTRLFTQDIEMNKLVVTTLEAHFRVYDMRCVAETKSRQRTQLTQHNIDRLMIALLTQK
jgi:hypothetical protein